MWCGHGPQNTFQHTKNKIINEFVQKKKEKRKNQPSL